jgi:hypothetical protein
MHVRILGIGLLAIAIVVVVVVGGIVVIANMRAKK